MWKPDRKLERVNITAAQITSGARDSLYGAQSFIYGLFERLLKCRIFCTTEYTHHSSSIELTISLSGLPHSSPIPTQEEAPVRQPASLVKTTFVQDGQVSAVDQAASDAEALRSPPGFEATSKVIDAATQLVGPVQLAIGAADSLTGALECLSEARGYMDGIIELVKTFADVRLHLLCRFSVIQRPPIRYIRF